MRLKPVDLKYPKLLKQLSDPPVLFVQGAVEFNSLPTIAVVGSRKMSTYGKEATHYFVTELVKAGFLIVSGFMYGVDAQAHTTALSLGGSTTGILGFGFDYMYPKHHVALKEQMLKSGNSLLTEFEAWVSPCPEHFRERNRIVSGMSLGVLVIEAASNSGSKVTARLAAEQGREVFAVPGPYNAPQSEGTKELINLGAKLVTNISDILDEL